MDSSPSDNYLITEVMTATPQRLQLMLIEAAIRSTQRARGLRQQGQDDQAAEALLHAQEILGEMLASLNREIDPGMVRRVGSVYLFVFRSLMEAAHERSDAKLDDALKVLETERETWRLVCEKLGSRRSLEDQAIGEQPADRPVSPPPVLPGGTAAPHGLPQAGFSLDA
jgi:flagellar protein FliS